MFAATAIYAFLSDTLTRGNSGEGSLELLDNVPRYLRPTVDALRYEALVAAGRNDSARSLREDLLRTHPEMGWRIEEADRGNGFIKTALRSSADVRPEHDHGG
jgi:hypothetical protein